MPYLKSKLHSVYNKERESRLQASLWGDDDDRLADTDLIAGAERAVDSVGLSSERASRRSLTKKIQKVIGVLYPWIHASSEGNCHR